MCDVFLRCRFGCPLSLHLIWPLNRLPSLSSWWTMDPSPNVRGRGWGNFAGVTLQSLGAAKVQESSYFIAVAIFGASKVPIFWGLVRFTSIIWHPGFGTAKDCTQRILKRWSKPGVGVAGANTFFTSTPCSPKGLSLDSENQICQFSLHGNGHQPISVL